MALGSWIAQIAKRIVGSAGVDAAIEGAGAKIKKDQRQHVEQHQPEAVKILSTGARAPAGNVAVGTPEHAEAMRQHGFIQNAKGEWIPNPLTKEGATSTIQGSAAAAVQNAPAPLAADIRSAAARIAAVESGNAEPGGQAPATVRPAVIAPTPPPTTTFIQPTQARFGSPAERTQLARQLVEARGRERHREAAGKPSQESIAGIRAAGKAAFTGESPRRFVGPVKLPLPPRPPTTAAPQPEPNPSEFGDRIAQAALAALNAGAAPPPEPPASTPGAPPTAGAPSPMPPPGGGPPPAPPPPGTAPSPASGAAPAPRAPLSEAAKVIWQNLRGKQKLGLPLPEHTVAGHSKEIMGLLKKPELGALFNPQQLFEGLHELIERRKGGGSGLTPLELTPAAQKVREFAAKQTAPLPEDEGELRKALKPLAKESGYPVGSLYKGAQELKAAKQEPKPAILAELIEPAKTLGQSFRDLINNLKSGDGLVNAVKGAGNVFHGLINVGRAVRGGRFHTGQGTLLGTGLRSIRGGFGQILGQGAGAAGGAGRLAAGAATGGEGAGGVGAAVAGGAGGGGGGIGAGAALAGGAATAGLAIGAVLALGAASFAAVAAMKRFAEATLESRRYLAKYNGAIAVAFVQLERSDILRTFATGQQTQGSTVALADAVNDMREAILPLDVTMKNLTNVLGIIAARVVQSASYAAQITPILGDMMRFFNFLMRFLNGPPKASPWTEAIRNQAARYASEMKDDKIPKLEPLPKVKPPWRGI